jgi:hypothetical protein
MSEMLARDPDAGRFAALSQVQIQGDRGLSEPRQCEDCGTTKGIIAPLHLDKGGPLFCLPCGSDWHGRYGRRRKLGRVVIKALAAYDKAGGNFDEDLTRFKLAAWGYPCAGHEADTIGAEIGDITSELLADVLQLTHPDRHPPERRELAKRVTQELVALQPFVFPAPKPLGLEPQGSDGSLVVPPAGDKEPSRLDLLSAEMRAFPCATCSDTIPHFYCDACRAEWHKRGRAKDEIENAKRRAWYRRRRAIRLKFQRPSHCRSCLISRNGRDHTRASPASWRRSPN